MIKTLLPLSILLCCSYFPLNAQLVNDDFSDGDFTNNPQWSGDLNNFTVNENFQVQLNFQDDPLRPAYISVLSQSGNLNDKEWRFDINLDFSPSGSNKVQIFLVSTTADLLDHQNTGSLQEGYFLEIGESGSEDAISLFYRNGENTQLIARGGDGDFASAFDVRIRVRRDASANWEIAIDPNKGEDFISIASGNDGSLTVSGSVGFICYFTSSRSTLFYFDNVYLGDYVTDTVPPQILEYEVLSNKEIKIIFSEELAPSSATNINNYLLRPGDRRPNNVVQDKDTVWLSFAEAFESGTDFALEVENISDAVGNLSVSEDIQFFYFEVEEAEVRDIVISEFFPDPTPVLGLPDQEFVEIYNRSEKFIDLQAWEISDNSFSSGTLPFYIMRPGEYLILAPSSAEGEYSQFGQVLVPSSWRALNNGGDSLIFQNAQGIQIDVLEYDLSWYQDQEKAEGGYSLEIINPALECFDKENWKASEAEPGGTPGAENSIADSSFSGSGPQLVSFQALSTTQLELRFDKRMKLNSLLEATYILNPEQEISEIEVMGASNNIVQLTLSSELQNTIFYEISIDRLEDCNGNISENLLASFFYDIVPPQFDSLLFLSDSILLLTFDEPLQVDSAMDIENYEVSPQIALSEVRLWSDRQVVLIWENDWSEGIAYSLSLNGVSDTVGNALQDFQQEIILNSLPKPSFNDLVITEIMANAREDRELPNREFVEIYNATAGQLSLVDVYFMDERDTVNLGLNYIEPGEYLLLAPNSAVEDLTPYGRVLGLSPWPNLNNRGDDLQLITEETIVNQAFYREDWYKERFKYEEGGYSLEIINPALECFDKENWKASEAEAGGTPGTENSIVDYSFTGSAPELISFKAVSRTQVELHFDKIMNLNSLLEANYTINPEVIITDIEVAEDLKNIVKLTLESELQNAVFYEISIDRVEDCNGNTAENLDASFLYDFVPPQLDSLLFLSDSILVLTFDEPLQVDSAMDIKNYAVSPQIALSEVRLWSDREVVLIWDNGWIEGLPYTLSLNGVSDTVGNALRGFQQEIILNSLPKPSFNELIITEVMANPGEDQELPDRQYVEIYNSTAGLLSLVDVNFMDERDTVNLGLIYIESEEYLLLAPNSAVEDLTPYGRVLGLSPWPNLNNRGDDLQLITDETIVNQAFYREDWYKENFKYDEGAWSLEIIDVENPCLGFSNWSASISDAQGTPGAVNSIAEVNPDKTGPQLKKAFAPNAREVYLYFTEPIEITQIRTNQFSIDPAIAIEKVEVEDLNLVKLSLSEELMLKNRYSIRADNVTDCVGNIINSDRNIVSFALAEPPEQGNIVLNEVLYDQKSGGADFIELLNISDKYINLSGWAIESNSQENIILENQNIIISPGQHLALTTDKASVVKDYPNSHDLENIVEVNLPTLINGEGFVRVKSPDQALEEYFEYSDDLHLTFLRTVDGVSLERINPEAPINEADSWTSASSSVGYASPGKVNSQVTHENVSYGKIEANPKTFAHDQPGRNFTLINYEMEDAGNIATVKIFDLKGTTVNTLANNETLSTSGFFRWDGIDLNGRKVMTGYYIIYFEIFTANGNTRVIKERVAVGF